MTNKLTQCKSLDDLLKNSEVEYLSKWIVLNDQKLATITQNKLYAGFSKQFNDIFDTQIRANDCEIEKLVCKLYNDSFYDCKDLKEHILHIINQFHHIHIACFSELDPISLDSNRMWGLYGSCGQGVVLQYSVENLKKWFDKFNQANQWSEFLDVCYYGERKRNNKLEFIGEIVKLHHECTTAEMKKPENKQLFHDVLIKNDDWRFKVNDYVKNSPITAIKDKLIEKYLFLLSTKSQEWQYEREWRFTYLNNKIFCDVSDLHKSYSAKIAKITKYYLDDKGKTNHEKMQFEFIKPDKIIFGWDVGDDENYQKLDNWAKSQLIERIHLDKTVNYEEYEFNIKTC